MVLALATRGLGVGTEDDEGSEEGGPPLALAIAALAAAIFSD